MAFLLFSMNTLQSCLTNPSLAIAACFATSSSACFDSQSRAVLLFSQSYSEAVRTGPVLSCGEHVEHFTRKTILRCWVWLVYFALLYPSFTPPPNLFFIFLLLLFLSHSLSMPKSNLFLLSLNRSDT